MEFIWAILYVVTLYALLIAYIVREYRYEERQRKLINKEVRRFKKNLHALDAVQDLDYLLGKFASIDDIINANNRIEKSLKKYAKQVRYS